MFNELRIVLSIAQTLFALTDKFGESLLGEVINPADDQLKMLEQMTEEAETQWKRLDALLDEVRAMTG